MLENEASLRTWRLSREADTEGIIDAIPLPDHRMAYLDYEGPVSGDRGNVARWDRGEYEVLVESPNSLELHLRGSRLTGHVILSRLADGNWVFERLSESA